MAIRTLGPFGLDAQQELLFHGAEPVPLGRRAIALLSLWLDRKVRSARRLRDTNGSPLHGSTEKSLEPAGTNVVKCFRKSSQMSPNRGRVCDGRQLHVRTLSP
jgi:hypothetical protein